MENRGASVKFKAQRREGSTSEGAHEGELSFVSYIQLGFRLLPQKAFTHLSLLVGGGSSPTDGTTLHVLWPSPLWLPIFPLLSPLLVVAATKGFNWLTDSTFVYKWRQLAHLPVQHKIGLCISYAIFSLITLLGQGEGSEWGIWGGRRKSLLAAWDSWCLLLEAERENRAYGWRWGGGECVKGLNS